MLQENLIIQMDRLSTNKISIASICLENIICLFIITHNSQLHFLHLKVNGMHQDKYQQGQLKKDRSIVLVQLIQQKEEIRLDTMQTFCLHIIFEMISIGKIKFIIVVTFSIFIPTSLFI